MLKIFLAAALLGCATGQFNPNNPDAYSFASGFPGLNSIAQPSFPGAIPGVNYAGVPQINYAATPSPTPNYAAAPVPTYSPVPVPNYNSAPIPNYTPAPIPNYNAAPVPNYIQNPVPNYAAAPIPNYNPTPIPNYAPAPVPNYAPAPAPTPNYAQAPVPNYNFAQPPQYANPQYDQVPFRAGEIDYVYTDPKTGNQHNQIEKTEDGITRGSYSVVDPDGTRRTVMYTADAVNGFRAVVNRGNQQNTIPQGNPIPAPSQEPLDPETLKGLAEREEALKKHARALARHAKQTAKQQGGN